MSDIESSSWSETAASNNQTPPAGWPEGQAPSTINDCAREMMAALKRDWDHNHVTLTSGGTANAQTLSYSVAPAAYVAGQTFAFKAGFSTTGPATLNVNGLGAKNIFWGGAALIGFEIVANAFYAVSYDGTQFNLVWSSLWGAPPTVFNLINGDCEVWQRGAGNSASIAVAASATAYTCDRGYLTTGANQASTVSAQPGLTSGSRFCARVQRNSGQTGTGTMTYGWPLATDQVVALRGSKLTLSAVLRAGANWSPAGGNLTMTLYVGTGTEGKRGAGFTGETNVASQTNAITTTATRYAVTSGSTVPTNATQGELQFTWTPVGTAGAADYFEDDEIQIDLGAAPLPFRRQLFADELARCKRFFWKTFKYGDAPAQNLGGNSWSIIQIPGATTATQYVMPFPVGMRAQPAITIYNPGAANAQVRNVTRGNDCTASASTGVREGYAGISFTTSIGSAANDTNAFHAIFDADL
jgi:hypothetical protein